MTWLSTMKLLWRLSEIHWLLLPFELVGNWMEDIGLDRGWIKHKPLDLRFRYFADYEENK